MEFLTDSYWYTPAEYLMTMAMVPVNQMRFESTSQTVWHISQYVYGYFSGNAVTYLGDGSAISFRIFATIIPSGELQVSFLPVRPDGVVTRILAYGKVVKKGTAYGFIFQRTGSPDPQATVASQVMNHWTFMNPINTSMPEWMSLPGTPDLNVTAVMVAGGFGADVYNDATTSAYPYTMDVPDWTGNI
jgi:hypothetical protein